MNSLTDKEINRASDGIDKALSTATRSDRGEVAFRILSVVRNLNDHIAFKIWKDVRPDQKMDINKVASKFGNVRPYQFVARFDHFLRASVSHFTPSEEGAERLMIKYYRYLLQLKKAVYDRYGMIILRNVDMFLEDLDEQTKDYYQKVATEIEKRLRTPPPKNFDNYYIDKIKPFFVNQEIYYEVALEPADEKPNKFNRITAFTKYDISTDYCVALSFSDATISVFNTDFPIKIITEWHVSIRPCELNNFAELLNVECSVSRGLNEYMITDEIRRNGKQANVSMFAFTATPKPTTIQLFGRLNTKGQREAFHIYSMKQAIEEGFILDVLQNYTTYDTFYQLNKEIEEDPRCKTADAKRQIARFVELHETNIAQRVEVIVEHFRTTVMPELGGMAKAMVITASRQGAVKYRQAFENYTQKKGYTDIKALVAFSGKVKLPDDDTEYSEASMNGFPEDRLTKEFDKDDYQVLLVANKYQTGFDQPKLCAMYVLKKLKGVSAVQTLSRLNRICPPFEKKTFVLDFVNTYEDIKAAFAPYYTTTLLSTSVTPTAIYDLEAQIDAYTVLDPDDIEKANELLYKGNISSKDKQKLTFYFKRAKNRIEQYELIKQHEIVSMMRHFVRFYEFLLQVSCFEDTDLHKKYNFITYLLAYINIKHPGGGYNLDGKIKATNFVQKKSEEHTTPNLVAQPVVKLPTAESFGLTEAKEERLSQIIAEINSRTGKAYDNDVAVKAMLQIRDILLKSDKLKTSARNNTVKDFEFSYFDDIDDALIEGLEQNQDFFSLLLSNDEIKRQVLGIFTDEIYKSLREA